MKVHVDQEKCIGSGNCADIASRVFSQREDDGIAEAFPGDVPADAYADVRQAATVCPVWAIEILEDDKR